MSRKKDEFKIKVGEGDASLFALLSFSHYSVKRRTCFLHSRKNQVEELAETIVNHEFLHHLIEHVCQIESHRFDNLFKKESVSIDEYGCPECQ